MPKLKDIAIEILQKCNSNCIFCSSMSKDSSTHIISLEKVLEIADFARENEVKEFSISGGEPLLYPALHDILIYCNNIGLKTRLYTSGNYETEKLNFFNQ